jgi:hypothetical protein
MRYVNLRTLHFSESNLSDISQSASDAFITTSQTLLQLAGRSYLLATLAGKELFALAVRYFKLA